MPGPERAIQKEMSEGFKPILIAGADYSAALKQPNPTWLALLEVLEGSGAVRLSLAASLNKKGTMQEKRNNFLHLRLTSLENVGSEGLYKALAETRPLRCGLDFPFGYPAPFLDWIRRRDTLQKGNPADSNDAWDRRHPGDTEEAGKQRHPGDREDAWDRRHPGDSEEACEDTGKKINSRETQPGVIPDHDWQLTRELASITFSELERAVAEFALETKPEPLRLTDQLVSPKGTSPLHRINPGLLKMTWQGAKLLLALRAIGFHVSPFDQENSNGAATAPKVMEIYPAALLKWLSLPHRRYKGTSATAVQTREELVSALARSSGMVLPPHKLHTVNSGRPRRLKLDIKPSLRHQCLADDNALDGVFAAIGAAISLIDLPAVNPAILETSPELSRQSHLVQREGWIYTPYLLKP